jgi:hypothetical protein
VERERIEGRDTLILKGKVWLRWMYEISGSQYGGPFWDGVAFHYYDDPQLSTFQAHVETLHAVMRGHGDVGEVWVTETGWTAPQRLTEARQANAVARVIAAACASAANPGGGVFRVDWFCFRDTPSFAHGLAESSMRTVKKSYHAFAATGRELVAKRFAREQAVEGVRGVRLLEFEDPETGRRTWIAWSEDGLARTVKVPARTDRAQTMLLDYDGTEEWSGEAASSDGWLRVQVTERPLFIRERPNDRLSRPDLQVDSVRFLSGDPRVGTADTLRAWVRNPGTRTTPARVPVRIRFRHEGTPLGDAQLPGAIPGGGTAQADLAFASLPGWMRGRGLIAAEANPDNDFVELDEADYKAYLVAQVR